MNLGARAETKSLTQSGEVHLKRASDWIGMGNLLGQRWEELCGIKLAALAQDRQASRRAFNLNPDRRISSVMLLDSNPLIRREAHGYKTPDVVLFETEDKGTYCYLRPCDAKFTLSWAEKEQIFSENLVGVLNNSPTARLAVQEKLDELYQMGRIWPRVTVREVIPNLNSRSVRYPVDTHNRVGVLGGRLISPDTDENRRYRKRDRPEVWKERVYTLQLSDQEASVLLANHPGQEHLSEAQRLNLCWGNPESNLDQPLSLAIVAAAMKALLKPSAEEMEIYLREKKYIS